MTQSIDLQTVFAPWAHQKLWIIYNNDKIPVDPRSGLPIDAQVEINRMTHPEAQFWISAGLGVGTGIVLTPESGLWCLDLDKCRDNDGWKPYVPAFLAQFPGAYVEVSKGLAGLHVIGCRKGPRPLHGTRNADFGAEFYTGARYIALTGLGAYGDPNTAHDIESFIAEYFPARDSETVSDEWRDTPVPEWSGPADEAELLQRALASRGSARAAFGTAATFAQLYHADADALAHVFPTSTPGKDWDGSAADLAFCNHAAFWTGSNHEMIARWLKGSKLYREKHEREDYIRSTVMRACSSQREWYKSGGSITPHINSAEAIESIEAPAPHRLTTNAKNQYDATLENVTHSLSSPSFFRIGFDTFRWTVMTAAPDKNDWRPITQVDLIGWRKLLAHEGYAPIGRDMMLDSVKLVAEENKFDTAQQWLESLHWDGIPRVEQFLHRYCGAKDTEYAKAVSRYIFSGLAARILLPGCQLDMIVVLQSPQGRRKSSGIAKLSPDPEFCTDGLTLDKEDDDFRRKIRGKLIIEVAELATLSRADAKIIKRCITRRVEEWVEKYETQLTRYPRRCMIIATTNEDAHLPEDETGNRRWLPISVTLLDVDAIDRDRDQLWAEGAALWRQHGVCWQDAERLAPAEHKQFESQDIWSDRIEEWLDTPQSSGDPTKPPLPPPGTRLFKLHDVLRCALHIPDHQMDSRNEKRVARVLRQLGYIRTKRRIDGKVSKVWINRATAIQEEEIP